MRPYTLLSVAALLGPAAAAQPAAETPPRRPALAAVERVLDAAVGQVAAPSALALLGGPGQSRGYRVAGVGAFFVLPPRRLPSHQPVFLFHTPSGRVVLDGPEGEELAERMAALQTEAERMNAEAERAYRRVRREIHVRFRDETGGGTAEDADTPDAANPPAPPWHFWFEVDAPDAPSPQTRASADELIGAVRGALTTALESEAARMPLESDEVVVVAVDFVDDPFLMGAGHPARTLVLKARYGDLDARRRGELGPDELRQRIVSEEY